MAGKRKQDAEASAAEQDNAKEQHDEDALRSKKKQERLEQNRISARESRKRKKTMIEELQRTVITLSKENRELNDRNENLRAQLMELSQKYPNVVSMDSILKAPTVNATEAAQAQEQVKAAATTEI